MSGRPTTGAPSPLAETPSPQHRPQLDRANKAVSHLYDPWHPAVLQLIELTIRRAQAHGKGVSVCGEMAGDPAFTDLLPAMGLRSFSMHPSRVASVKQRVLRADTRRLAAALPRVLAAESPAVEAGLVFSGAGGVGGAAGMSGGGGRLN